LVLKSLKKTAKLLQKNNKDAEKIVSKLDQKSNIIMKIKQTLERNIRVKQVFTKNLFLVPSTEISVTEICREG
jgi:hypothetical protein